MAPGYPFVPGEPWGKDHTNQSNRRSVYFPAWYNSRECDWQILTCSPFVPGRPGDPRSPCCPWRGWEWGMIRKWRRECTVCQGERLPWWKWAKDKPSQYLRGETANWLVPSPFETAYIWFCPLLYTSLRHRDSDLALIKAEQCLLGPFFFNCLPLQTIQMSKILLPFPLCLLLLLCPRFRCTFHQSCRHCHLVIEPL